MFETDDDEVVKQKRQGVIEALLGDQPVVSKPTPVPVDSPATPFQGATDASASKYAPRIVKRAGQTYLQEHGNERLLQPGDEQTQGEQYASDFWAKYPTGFQPDVGGGQTATGSPVGAQSNAGYQRKGWAFNSPTGGRSEFDYTPQSYGEDMTGFSGFSPMGAGSSDPTALKNIFRNAAAGLGGGEGGYTEADLDETVARLNAQGIQARKVDPYQIDFGTGEGPIQVRSSKNEVWWNNRATEGQGSSGGGMGVMAGGPQIETGGEGGDALSRIHALIAALLQRQ